MSKKRCKFCFSRVSEDAVTCSVCKLGVNKVKKDLTKEEKSVWYAARNLYTIGFLATLGGVIGVLSSGVLLFGVNNWAQVGIIIFYGLFSVLGILVGLSLRRYKRWSYIGGIVVYSVLILLNLIGLNTFGLFFSVVFLVCIIWPTSRKLLYREL